MTCEYELCCFKGIKTWIPVPQDTKTLIVIFTHLIPVKNVSKDLNCDIVSN